MGVYFVVTLENRLKRSQEEAIDAFGGDETLPVWELFAWEGRCYATWTKSPRYFNPQAGSPEWEAIRLYLVRARDFFGSDRVLIGNDVLHLKTPLPGWDFVLPWDWSEEIMAEPDREQFPELADVHELQGIFW
jgi:hypothetical protein